MTGPDLQRGRLLVTGLDVAYGDRRVLHDITLHAGKNQVVALLGNNGAGKTTLLRTISGTVGGHKGTVESGRIEWDGQAIVKAPAWKRSRRGLVHVPEGRHVFGRMTVAENLRVGAVAAGRDADHEDSLARALELFPQLATRLKERSSMLSGGQQQMVAIARGLMSNPSLILLDEPFLGLSPKVSHEIAEALKQISSQGTGVVLVEQNSALALQLADHAYLLELGRIVLNGEVGTEVRAEDVLRRYTEVSGKLADRGVAK